MNLGKKWLFLIGNGVEIRPLEKGRKCPEVRQTKVPENNNELFKKNTSLYD